MKIALANDHAGHSLREAVMETVRHEGHELIDFGHDGEDSVDYPDYARLAVEAVLRQQADRAILICGTGIGMCITANKFPGIRCALCYDVYSAEMARRHNNANVLALRGRLADANLARQIVEAFLREPFLQGRQQRRLDKIHQIEIDCSQPSC